MNNKTNKDFLPDYKVFKKTKEEKAEAYTIKKRWERNMRVFHGNNWKKKNNYPFTLTDI